MGVLHRPRLRLHPLEGKRGLMITAGGNEQDVFSVDEWFDALKEQAARDAASLRDPSLRDVLAQLDRIEAKLDALNARMDADEVARG